MCMDLGPRRDVPELPSRTKRGGIRYQVEPETAQSERINQFKPSVPLVAQRSISVSGPSGNKHGRSHRETNIKIRFWEQRKEQEAAT